MKLAEYLKREGLTLGQFGARVGVAKPTVPHWVHGNSRPDWFRIRAIQAATGGEVTAEDFVPPAAPGGDAESTAGSA